MTDEELEQLKARFREAVQHGRVMALPARRRTRARTTRITLSVLARCAAFGLLAAVATGDVRWSALGPVVVLADELRR